MASSNTKWIWIIVGIVVGGGVLMVALCAGLGLWGWREVSEQFRMAMNENTVIREHLGEVSEISVDFTATGEVPGDDVFVYNVTGEKGTGVVSAEFLTVDADSERIASGTLKLPDGRVLELVPEE
jgi:hypothetical protein